MHRTHRREAQRARSCLTALAGVLALAACVSLRPLSRTRAIDVAQRNLCGAAHAGRDSTCTVRSVEPIKGGYRVLLDRRPPAGNDRVTVEVRRGGDQIDVVQQDTTKSGVPE